ncbi:hypothetical protein [Nitratireductor sp. B36]|uniref:hypothetical protein n=1 Tax=Nitratireductor sp. B36 TaxID=2762059 RepID=UPI00351D3ACE
MTDACTGFVSGEAEASTTLEVSAGLALLVSTSGREAFSAAFAALGSFAEKKAERKLCRLDADSLSDCGVVSASATSSEASSSAGAAVAVCVGTLSAGGAGSSETLSAATASIAETGSFWDAAAVSVATSSGAAASSF